MNSNLELFFNNFIFINTDIFFNRLKFDYFFIFYLSNPK
jgi:hypothetical protein